MERPSHNTFPSAHPFSNRLVSTGLAVSIPLAILWGLAYGLVNHKPTPVCLCVLNVDRVIEKIKPSVPPPPPPKMEHLAIIDPVPPRFTTDGSGTDDHGGGVSTGSRTTDVVQPLPPAGPTRALSGIAASHSQPPYPLIEERLGEEGTVSLRLTVTADGHVAKADIVTSSGHPRLDEAAQNWIVAHWLYRPALDNGQAVASQVTANVNFKLDK